MMKTNHFLKTVKGSAIASVTAMAVMLGTAHAATYQFSPQSDIGFYIKQVGVKTVDGEFGKVQSKVDFDPNNVETAQAKLVMDVDSINLTHGSLKNLVMGKDFFNAAEHKEVVFDSTQFKALGNDKYQIAGNLTLRGVTKPVTFDATIKPDAKNPNVLAIDASTQIKRSDFGMKPAIGGVGEMINITVDGQLQQS